MNELHLAWGNFISFNHQLTCPRRDTVLHCCDDGCTLIQLKRIFQYQLRQHAETRSSICNIPVTERYGYVGRAEEKQEEKVRFDRFIQYVQSKIIREEKKLQSIYNSLGLLWLSFFTLNQFHWGKSHKMFIKTSKRNTNTSTLNYASCVILTVFTVDTVQNLRDNQT